MTPDRERQLRQVEDAAQRLVLSTLLFDDAPRDLTAAVCARDCALHDLAHVLGLPCPLCRDDRGAVVDVDVQQQLL